MPSQKMRLEAEMRDNASPAVRKLRQELADLQATSAETRGVAKLNAEIAKLSSEATTDASPAVRKLRAELAELQKSTAEHRAIKALTKEVGALKKMSGEMQATAGMKAFGAWFGEAKTAASGVMGVVGGLPSLLGAVGIGGIAAGASVAGMAAELKRLGEAALDMKELSRETGISLDFINRWSHAGEHFAVGADAMKGAIDGFASQLPDFDRGIGNLFKEFSIWPDLVRKMKGESPADALLDALKQAEEVGRTKGPEVQKQILESIFPGHDADMERLFGDRGLKGLIEQLQKPWAGFSPDFLKASQELRDATSAFNNELVRFENTIGPSFLGQLRDIVKDGEKFIGLFKWLYDAEQRGEKGIENLLTSPPKKQQDGKTADEKAAPDSQHSPWEGAGRASGRGLRRLWDYFQKSSYDGAGFGSLLQNASSTNKDAGAAAGAAVEDRKALLITLREAAVAGAAQRDGNRSLLQNASFTTGGTGSGTMEGAIAEGSKSGVLAALREMQIENGLKGDGTGEGSGGGAGGSSGSSGGGAAGGGGGSGGGGGLEPGGTGSAKAGHKAANNATLMKAAQEQLLKEGVSQDHVKAAAAALVGNVVQESGGDPNKVHDHGTGYGLYGARLDRRDRMLAWLKENGFEKNSAEGQMKYMAHEAMTDRKYKRTAEALRQATQGNLGAVTDTAAKDFEKPLPATANYGGRRNNAAAAFGTDIGGGESAVADSTPMSDDVRQRLQEAKRHAFLGMNQECVSLARAFSKTAESVFEWRRGDSAQDGKLKPGTPIATFLDRAGRVSDRYAGGGEGTRGANRDHAAVFEHYATQNGRRGMMVLEQSKGRPVHERFYPFGEGAGEKNGSNYFAIKSARTGTYLGQNNPMNRADSPAVAANTPPHRRADSPAVAANPPPHRRADADLSGSRRDDRETGSEHLLKIDLRDPAGHVKSTHLQSRGPMRVEMRNRWKTSQSPLVQA